jgi:predicted ATPase
MKCRCDGPHNPKLIVLTGGPGAGKTAVLEVVRRQMCQHVVVLPEAAGIVYGGGFPRQAEEYARRAAQRAIYHVQSQLERLVLDSGHRFAVGLADRGLLDSLAYWPGDEPSFFHDVADWRDELLARYQLVIHLRTPTNGYNHGNALRIESSAEAAAIDQRIEKAWRGHPRREFVDSTVNFVDKLERTLELVRAELPECCLAAHPVPRARSA